METPISYIVPSFGFGTTLHISIQDVSASTFSQLLGDSSAKTFSTSLSLPEDGSCFYVHLDDEVLGTVSEVDTRRYSELSWLIESGLTPRVTAELSLDEEHGPTCNLLLPPAGLCVPANNPPASRWAMLEGTTPISMGKLPKDIDQFPEQDMHFLVTLKTRGSLPNRHIDAYVDGVRVGTMPGKDAAKLYPTINHIVGEGSIPVVRGYFSPTGHTPAFTLYADPHDTATKRRSLLGASAASGAAALSVAANKRAGAAEFSSQFFASSSSSKALALAGLSGSSGAATAGAAASATAVSIAASSSSAAASSGGIGFLGGIPWQPAAAAVCTVATVGAVSVASTMLITEDSPELALPETAHSTQDTGNATQNEPGSSPALPDFMERLLNDPNNPSRLTENSITAQGTLPDRVVQGPNNNSVTVPGNPSQSANTGSEEAPQRNAGTDNAGQDQGAAPAENNQQPGTPDSGPLAPPADETSNPEAPQQSRDPEPVEPTEPAQRPEPTRPAEPTEDSETSENSRPNPRPTESGRPTTRPVEPTDSEETTEPSEPSEPVETTDPAEPTEPTEEETTDPVEPTEPSDPTEPTEPTDPTDPGTPGDDQDVQDPENDPRWRWDWRALDWVREFERSNGEVYGITWRNWQRGMRPDPTDRPLGGDVPEDTEVEETPTPQPEAPEEETTPTEPTPEESETEEPEPSQPTEPEVAEETTETSPGNNGNNGGGNNGNDGNGNNGNQGNGQTPSPEPVEESTEPADPTAHVIRESVVYL